ncbi:MAG TPA: ABC transporter permease [Bacillota bacterium]
MKILRLAAGAFVAAHGLIHLMGFAAYWPLATLPDLPYKTTLLSGRWDVGGVGMKVMAVFWLLAALCYALSVAGFLSGKGWWRPFMLGATALSTVLCVLDWAAAYRGGIIDLAIFAWLGLEYLILGGRNRGVSAPVSQKEEA